MLISLPRTLCRVVTQELLRRPLRRTGEGSARAICRNGVRLHDPIDSHPKMSTCEQVLAPRPPGRAGEGFAPAKLLAEVPLAQSGAAFSGSARAAAIAVGTLDTPTKDFVRPLPKQVQERLGFKVLNPHILMLVLASSATAARRLDSLARAAAVAVGRLETPSKDSVQPLPKQAT